MVVVRGKIVVGTRRERGRRPSRGESEVGLWRGKEGTVFNCSRIVMIKLILFTTPTTFCEAKTNSRGHLGLCHGSGLERSRVRITGNS